jgi:hypothetical protein
MRNDSDPRFVARLAALMLSAAAGIALAPPAAAQQLRMPTTPAAPPAAAGIKIFKSGDFRPSNPAPAPPPMPLGSAETSAAVGQIFGTTQFQAKLTKRTLDLQHPDFPGEASLNVIFGLPGQLPFAANKIVLNGVVELVVHSKANAAYMFDVVVQPPDSNCQFTINGPDGAKLSLPCAADASTPQHLVFGLQATDPGSNYFSIENSPNDPVNPKPWTFYSATITAQ